MIGNWGLTYKGRKFYPMDLQPDMIDIEEIAHSLSNLCRFGGHCKTFYSVAQHSLLVCDNVSQPNKKVALLHDATEAYIGDMIRPLKVSMPAFEEIESKAWKAICVKFSISETLPLEVKVADARALLTEKRDLLSASDFEWEFPQCQFPDLLPYNKRINWSWHPASAKSFFLQKCLELGIQ